MSNARGEMYFVHQELLDPDEVKVRFKIAYGCNINIRSRQTVIWVKNSQ